MFFLAHIDYNAFGRVTHGLKLSLNVSAFGTGKNRFSLDSTSRVGARAFIRHKKAKQLTPTGTYP
jgi:hypothetical protein